MSASKTAVFAGIGRLGVPVAERLIDKGWRAAVSYRERGGSRKTVENLIEQNPAGTVGGFEAELTDYRQCEGFINGVRDKFSRMDALINIASGYPDERRDWKRWERGGGIEPADRKYYSSNFVIARNTIKAAVSALDEERPVCVINFSDARSLAYFDFAIFDPYGEIGGIMDAEADEMLDAGLRRLKEAVPPRHVNPYTLAKIDIAHLTLCSAVEYASKGVRVNCIAPGPMIPPPGSSEKQASAAINQTLLKRWGGTEPIVHGAEYLLENDFVTGQILTVDGGQMIYNLQGSKFPR